MKNKEKKKEKKKKEGKKIFRKGNGKLIVFEGLDASGKKTQATIFARRLREKGKRTRLLHFPAYHTHVGRLIAKYLSGEFGAREAIPPETIAFLYALDRLQFKKEIEENLAKGVFVVCDRYVQSNLYQAARVPKKRRAQFIEWLDALEAEMPKADVVFFLDVPPEVAAKQFAKRGAKNVLLRGRGKRGKDIHERDAGFQKEVRNVYLSQARARKWIVVKCVEGKEFRAREEIARRIWRALEKGLEIEGD